MLEHTLLRVTRTVMILPSDVTKVFVFWSINKRVRAQIDLLWVGVSSMISGSISYHINLYVIYQPVLHVNKTAFQYKFASLRMKRWLDLPQHKNILCIPRQSFIQSNWTVSQDCPLLLWLCTTNSLSLWFTTDRTRVHQNSMKVAFWGSAMTEITNKYSTWSTKQKILAKELSVISLVHHYLENYAEGEKSAYLDADNYVGQNKNNATITISTLKSSHWMSREYRTFFYVGRTYQVFTQSSFWYIHKGIPCVVCQH